MASAPGSSSKAAPVIDVVDDSDNDGDEDSVDEEQLQEYREMVENLGNFAVRMMTTKKHMLCPPPGSLKTFFLAFCFVIIMYLSYPLSCFSFESHAGQGANQ
jgi:hypothetical protein